MLLLAVREDGLATLLPIAFATPNRVLDDYQRPNGLDSERSKSEWAHGYRLTSRPNPESEERS
jgi:hypothetical protein